MFLKVYSCNRSPFIMFKGVLNDALRVDIEEGVAASECNLTFCYFLDALHVLNGCLNVIRSCITHVKGGFSDYARLASAVLSCVSVGVTLAGVLYIHASASILVSRQWRGVTSSSAFVLFSRDNQSWQEIHQFETSFTKKNRNLDFLIFRWVAAGSNMMPDLSSTTLQFGLHYL